MPEPTSRSPRASLQLPDAPNLEWLRKQAKRRLDELRATNAATKLAEAQFDLAGRYGFTSWRALKSHVDSLSMDGQLFAAATNGDVTTLAALLEMSPAKLTVRNQPYEWSLLHVAAFAGHLPAVTFLLGCGLDANTREKGDNTFPMHWAAAAGHLDVVKRLADAGGDVVGLGDVHEMQMIGWAASSDEVALSVRRSVAAFLVSRGVRHTMYSAVALDLAEEVRRIVHEDPSQLMKRQSKYDEFRLPLHVAVQKNLPEMVELLLELGADPSAADGAGVPAIGYATSTDSDRSIVNALLARGGGMDVFTALVLGDWTIAERLLKEELVAGEKGGATGVLHLMAKRNNVVAVKWLLEHGVDPNVRWSHWTVLVTPLHLAASQGHGEVVRLLLDHGADPDIRDSMYNGDAEGWADHHGRPEIVAMLDAYRR